jgi:hypothetical protein
MKPIRYQETDNKLPISIDSLVMLAIVFRIMILDIFLDRKAEEFVYQFISDCKAGPRIYGMTEDVRIEEFINSKVLKTRQMLTDPII